MNGQRLLSRIRQQWITIVQVPRSIPHGHASEKNLRFLPLNAEYIDKTSNAYSSRAYSLLRSIVVLLLQPTDTSLSNLLFVWNRNQPLCLSLGSSPLKRSPSVEIKNFSIRRIRETASFFVLFYSLPFYIQRSDGVNSTAVFDRPY